MWCQGWTWTFGCQDGHTTLGDGFNFKIEKLCVKKDVPEIHWDENIKKALQGEVLPCMLVERLSWRSKRRGFKRDENCRYKRITFCFTEIFLIETTSGASLLIISMQIFRANMQRLISKAFIIVAPQNVQLFCFQMGFLMFTISEATNRFLLERRKGSEVETECAWWIHFPPRFGSCKVRKVIKFTRSRYSRMHGRQNAPTPGDLFNYEWHAARRNCHLFDFTRRSNTLPFGVCRQRKQN